MTYPGIRRLRRRGKDYNFASLGTYLAVEGLMPGGNQFGWCRKGKGRKVGS